jgi:competence protein ComEC
MVFFLSFLAGIAFYYAFLYFPFSAISAVLFSAVWFVIQKRYAVILILLIGFCYALFRIEPAEDMARIFGRKAVVTGSAITYPSKTSTDSYRQEFRIVASTDALTELVLDELPGHTIILFSDNGLNPGIEYSLLITFMRNNARLNPGQVQNIELRALLNRIIQTGGEKKSFLFLMEQQRNRLNRYFTEHFHKDSGVFLAALTTGETNISDTLRDAFNATGLTHILSISGTHFGLFSVFLFTVFRVIINLLPYRILQRVTLFLAPSQAAAILCFPFMLAYLLLSGGSVPAVRSFIMIGLFLAGVVIVRKGFWLNSLLFAAVVLAVWEPGVILTLSFQLSFLAVLFIGLFLIRSDENTLTSKKRYKQYLVNSIMISLAASLGTAPLVASYFHYFSVISPLANLLVAPFIGFLLIPLAVVSSFLFLMTGHFVFAPLVSYLSDAAIYVVQLLSAVPFADIKIPASPPILAVLFYAGCLPYFLFGRKKYMLLIPFIPFALYFTVTASMDKHLAVTFLDVGQGDASVIELPDNRTLVIDTGRTGREVASFLAYRGKRTVDAVVLSHAHPDHAGGLDMISDRVRVSEIWSSGRTDSEQKTLMRGDTVDGQGYRICVLHPYPEFSIRNMNEYDKENNTSLVLKIESRYGSFLFTGDIEDEAEEDITHLQKWLRSNVMKVPHHGGRTSLNQAFLEAVSPGIAVISSGRDNSFGHPHQETLSALSGTQIFRTDWDGAVKAEAAPEGLAVKTCADFRFRRAHNLKEEFENIKKIFTTW